ncbi:RNA-directed DNA polymerase from mobile element jockey-like [Brachionus plicatilis]|uniref:RNA-directed DNA polymerase from mobile element jockey-like n=1 Tax=Brachionus plicatilis TaxID=10195 RepID=A0A3M7Q2P3_BRAPC|nr:RNA-directed DNA polymerase from mobile element jockey-like [Brachionus plicatilis]
MIEEIKERCNLMLNLIKILSNRKWGLDINTLGNLYKYLIGSILDYSFPCLNSLLETNINRLEVIQNSAVRSILKLRYDIPSNIVHHEAFNKLKLLKVSDRLFELSERYDRAGHSHSVPLTVRLVEEYNKGFRLRYIEYSTPLSFSSFIEGNKLVEEKKILDHTNNQNEYDKEDELYTIQDNSILNLENSISSKNSDSSVYNNNESDESEDDHTTGIKSAISLALNEDGAPMTSSKSFKILPITGTILELDPSSLWINDAQLNFKIRDITNTNMNHQRKS